MCIKNNLKRGTYTFFDILGRMGFEMYEVLPKPWGLIFTIPMVLPAMLLAAIADSKGESSQDVL